MKKKTEICVTLASHHNIYRIYYNPCVEFHIFVWLCRLENFPTSIFVSLFVIIVILITA